MSETSSQRVVFHDVSEVVLAVPYLAGYTPRNAVAIMGMKPDLDGRDVLAIAAVLPAPDGTVADAPWRELDRAVAAPMVKSGASSAFIVGFHDTGHTPGTPLPYRALVAGLGQSLRDAGVEVRDALFTDGTTCWSYVHADPASRQPQEWTIPESTRSLVAARFAYVGVAAPGSREELIAELDPADAATVETVTQAYAGLPEPGNVERWRDRAISQVHLLLGASRPLEPSEVAMIGNALSDERVRDALAWDLAQPTADNQLAAETLAQVVRESPRQRRAPAATLLGLQRWLTGDGVRASIALETAMSADPAFSTAHRLDALLATGVNPATLRSAIRSVPREVFRHGRPTPAPPSTPAPGIAPRRIRHPSLGLAS